MTDRVPHPDPVVGRMTPSYLASVASASTIYLVVVLWNLGKRMPLGHDESVYLLRAREFAGQAVEGGDGRFWAPYRAPGLPALISVQMRTVGDSITVSRSIVALFGLGCVIGTAELARRLAGTLAGAIAPWIVIVTPAFLAYTSVLLLDVPGTFMALLATLVLERATRDGTVRWWPAMAVPAVIMAGVYMRFGTTTNAAGGLLAVVACRADLLFAAAVRTRNFLRLTAVAGVSGIAGLLVLLVPWMTGSAIAPLEAQQNFRDAKGLSPWYSWETMLDLLWPNGSRVDEAVTWLGLSVVLLGTALAIAALGSREHRRGAVAGIVSSVVWVVLLNYALGEMFGNYLGLGVPFIALLTASGLAYGAHLAATVRIPQRTVVAVAMVVAVIVTTSGSLEALRTVDRTRNLLLFRQMGSALGEIAPDGECGVVTSYVQIAYYSDCGFTTWVRVLEDPIASATDPDAGLTLGTIREDEVYLAVVGRGKRQPKGDELDPFLANSEQVATFEINGRKAELRRVLDVEG